jgi:RNA polymerase sigma-70 factor (ECF subfamily)
MAALGEAALLPSDEALVERICKGSVEEFDVLYRRYFPRIYRFVSRRVGNRADVEEAVQEIFFSLFSSIDNYRGDAPFSAWAFGLTRRALANRYKRKRQDLAALPAEDGELGALVASDDGDPHAAYELSERLDHLRGAMERLSEDQWELFRLHHLEHVPIEEIAARTHRSEDAVKSHLYRARKTLLAR